MLNAPPLRNPSSTDLPATDSHLEVLRLLETHPEYSQRQLSSALGLSLGKTHYILKALLDKGMVKVNNFRRSDNKLGYLYVLTPTGVRHRALLTRSFLAQKRREFASLKEEIALLEKEAASGALDADSHQRPTLASTPIPPEPRT